MKKSLLLVSILFLLSSFFVSAQELASTKQLIAQSTQADVKDVKETKAAKSDSTTISFAGSVDTYFRSNLTTKNKALDGGFVAPGSSFANANGFAIGMVNLVGSLEKGNTGFVADLVYGPRGDDAVFNSNGNPAIVNQLYAYWNVSDNVTLTIGNFNTFLGYEVISPTANFNYSTSYMFSYGPFSHTGIKADIALSDKVSAMVAIMNPTDFTEFNPFGTYTLGGQLGYTGDAGSIFFNVLYGDQDGTIDEDFATEGETSSGATFQADITAGFNPSDALYLGLNTTINSTGVGESFTGGSISDLDGDASTFYGIAGYAQVTTSDIFALGLRLEYFGETNGGAGAIGGYDEDGNASIIQATLSGNISLGSMTLIPELRIDSASEDIFPDSDLAPTGSLASFLLAAVYSF